ncbi:MAG: tRNA(His) guanylyltransferase Thg1 family protein [Chloroflexota bacterium]
MKFKELDQKMRVFETAHDHCVLPEIYMVARIDGRSFTRLTKDVHKFEAPFDLTFRDYMVETTKHLMNCGFDIIYGYTQSDEISLLFHLNDQTFGRKLRKFNSVLAGEASAKFTILLGDIASFDCRVVQLPTKRLVIDYFRWRQEDSQRNSLNAHCYWVMRHDGKSVGSATSTLHKMKVSDKNELLFQHGINFNDLPTWQKRGTGLYWETYEKQGYNPITNETVTAQRRRIKIDYELPMKDAYNEFIDQLIRRS